MLHNEANPPTSTSRNRGTDAQPEPERQGFPHPDNVASASHDDEVNVQIRYGFWDDERLWLCTRGWDWGGGGEGARDGDWCSGLGSGTEGGTGSKRPWGR